MIYLATLLLFLSPINGLPTIQPEYSTTDFDVYSASSVTEDDTTTKQFEPAPPTFTSSPTFATSSQHHQQQETLPSISSTFSCENRMYGYYADPENDCVVYHVCTNITMPTGSTQVHRASFRCGSGTVFSQMHRTCVHPEVALPLACQLAPQFYSINYDFGVMQPEMHEIQNHAQLNTIPGFPSVFQPWFNRITAPIREFLPFIPELDKSNDQPPSSSTPLSVNDEAHTGY